MRCSGKCVFVHVLTQAGEDCMLVWRASWGQWSVGRGLLLCASLTCCVCVKVTHVNVRHCALLHIITTPLPPPPPPTHLRARLCVKWGPGAPWRCNNCCDCCCSNYPNTRPPLHPPSYPPPSHTPRGLFEMGGSMPTLPSHAFMPSHAHSFASCSCRCCPHPNPPTHTGVCLRWVSMPSWLCTAAVRA